MDDPYQSIHVFSSPDPKAQDELLWTPSSVVVVRLSSSLNVFSSEYPGPTFIKIHVAPSFKGGGLKILKMVTVR